jgi:hypothetical protein
VISCNKATVSFTHVPFHTTITHGLSFLIISFNISFAFNLLCKNILLNLNGFHNSSKTAILQPAAYHGSIAKTFLPYSGFVINKLPRFCLKVSIASSSHISDNNHLNSFSTDLKSILNQSLNASDNSFINGNLISNILV